jgi:formate hydrogenlyase subunit 4
MWLLGCLLVGTLVPLRTGSVVLDMLVSLVGLGALAVGVGAVESIMARLRLVRVPQVLIAASILAIVALFLVAR